MAIIKVTVERIDGYCKQPKLIGDSFIVDGGKIIVKDNTPICMWALQSMMPIFPILQQAGGSRDHWTGKVNQFCCPDPKGRVHYYLERIES
ncbi:TIGR04076 family protein [Desulfobacula sp.]|uniref:TIGR04076 family protein n=1 Tax=Desulfobacula sp. TaxID=2593537 RepID=UPI00261B598C|nr:TIGR04076 family protein [Desulfobacula sp.]